LVVAYRKRHRESVVAGLLGLGCEGVAPEGEAPGVVGISGFHLQKAKFRNSQIGNEVGIFFARFLF